NMACNMGGPPDVPFWVYSIFAIPPLPPKAVNDNPFPPPAEPPPPPPPDPKLTQRLGPKRHHERASRGHRQPLNDAAELHALRRGLWDYLDVEEAKGRKVKQDPEAVDEVMRMAEYQIPLIRTRGPIGAVRWT